MKIFSCFAIILLLSILSCTNQQQREERLVKQNCGTCHAYPTPALLDKKTWEKDVFPEMAFRMGLDKTALNNTRFEDQYIIARTLPKEPMVSEEEWERIKRYYISQAPDSLIIPDRVIEDSVNQFVARPLQLSVQHHQSVTHIKQDIAKNKIFIGTRPGKLYQTDANFNVVDSIKLSSAISKLSFNKAGDPIVMTMGIMDPNEQSLGAISILHKDGDSSSTFIDSLQRPVDFQIADLDNDGIEDYVVCNFGNFTGSLSAYKGQPDGKFRRYVLQALPGARKVIVKDFDGNGTLDIMALMTQADERVVLLYNLGNFQFRLATLLRFNPVQGSSYFDIADFNNDGKFDIVYTNGDNADFSPILKPYHGVHIYLNSGTNEFKESLFYPMHGASQVCILDFDEDGDLDIAATSFFPDFINHPDHSFIYLENTGDGYNPHTTKLAEKGRWMTMEPMDYDRDGDIDIVLGSLTFPTKVPKDLFNRWTHNKISLLVLQNKLK